MFEAAIARAGMLRVNSLQELFSPWRRWRVLHQPEHGAVLTNGGGAGAWRPTPRRCTCPLAWLGASTVAQLDGVLPQLVSYGNLVDIIGDDAGSAVDAVQILLATRRRRAALLINALTAIVPSAEIAQALITLPQAQGRPHGLLDGGTTGAGAPDLQEIRYRRLPDPGRGRAWFAGQLPPQPVPNSSEAPLMLGGGQGD